jgi:hypothetical protein
VSVFCYPVPMEALRLAFRSCVESYLICNYSELGQRALSMEV